MSNPFLIGQKTILRPLSVDDTQRATKWMNDPETRRNLTVRFPMGETAEKSWIEKNSTFTPNPQNIMFAIETKEDGKHIGNMGLHDINWIDRNGVTGTVIGESEFRKKGYGTDAKMLLLQYAFETLGMHKIISYAFARNEASVAYSKRCGYVVEARLKEDKFLDGGWHDIIVLACFYSAWKEAFETYQKR